LDEPTAVLTPQETKKLFDILRRLKADGCSVIIITHKLNEVMDISDWVTVMRKGEVTGTVKTSETSPVDLTNMMVGETVDLQIERPVVQQGETVLELDNLSVVDREKVHKLKSITFNLHKGEILGVAGVAGSGQKELCEAIAGLYPVESGDIRYKHESLVGKTSRQIIEIGISMSFVPEDRLGMGLAASMDMVHNVMLKSYYHQRSFLLNKHEPAEKSKELVEKLNIKTPGIYHPVKQLSGGNIQKILLGRELDSNPNVIITAYPTRGLDIGSTNLIYDLLNEQKVKDTAILYVGEDLDVLMELCDRIMILCDGELISIVDAKTIKKDELGLMMAGQRLEDLNV
jgi:simple sugar transport system ATP-binding protein